jgi:ferredoxin-like protein FixX
VLELQWEMGVLRRREFDAETRLHIIKVAVQAADVTTHLPEAGPAYAWQLSRTPRISPQTNTCLCCTLCPHSCAPGKDFPVGHPLLQVKHA